MLVLPTLIALDRWRRADPRVRVLLGVAMLLFVGMIALTATLAAGIAVAAGAIVWWWLSSPTPRTLRTPLLAAAAVTLLVAIGVAATPRLRTRVVEKSIELSRGDINGLLTGRLDGWRAASAMLWRAPITGVGQGAFRAEYADTRLALEARGVRFFPGQLSVILATPHNEALSVAAEQGVPGLLALAWSLWIVWRSARRLLRDPENRPLAWSGLIALTVLCVVSFPLHVASVAWPWLLFLAWLFRAADERAPEPAASPSPRALPTTHVATACAALAAMALAWQTLRTNDRITASILLARVEARTLAAIQQRHAPSTMFAEHLAWLDTAARLDPLEIGIPMARGTQFYLLRRSDDALAAYHTAASLEPRPEIDLNIARALLQKGDRTQARAYFARAVQLNDRLREELPPGALD
jgi:hypothetical protein